MSEPKIVFNWSDDENCRITYDEQPIAHINHDEHGWDGMTAVRDAVMRLAKAVDIPVEIVGSEGV